MLSKVGNVVVRYNAIQGRQNNGMQPTGNGECWGKARNKRRWEFGNVGKKAVSPVVVIGTISLPT